MPKTYQIISRCGKGGIVGEWREAKQGSRTSEGFWRGLPMMKHEAETFQAMEARGATSEKDAMVEYKINS